MNHMTKVIPELASIHEHDSFDGLIIVPIQFETDPVTGFFMRCPNCKKISAFQFSSLTSERIDCNTINCKFNVDVGEIKGKIFL